MALGLLAIVASLNAVGAVKFDKCTLVGDNAYVAGGSVGLLKAYRALKKNKASILALIPAGPQTGSAALEYTPEGPAVLVASVDPVADLISLSAHGFVAGNAVQFQPRLAGSVPGGLVAGATYYVIAAGLTANAFAVSATVGGASINITDVGVNDLFVATADKLLVRVPTTGVESAVADQSATTYSFLAISG